MINPNKSTLAEILDEANSVYIMIKGYVHKCIVEKGEIIILSNQKNRFSINVSNLTTQSCIKSGYKQYITSSVFFGHSSVLEIRKCNELISFDIKLISSDRVSFDWRSSGAFITNCDDENHTKYKIHYDRKNITISRLTDVDYESIMVINGNDDTAESIQRNFIKYLPMI